MEKEYTDKLKPCPFCGSKAYEQICEELIVIGCEKCGYHLCFDGLICRTNTDVPIVYDKDARKKAREKWNRRSE